MPAPHLGVGPVCSKQSYTVVVCHNVRPYPALRAHASALTAKRLASTAQHAYKSPAFSYIVS